MFFLIIWLFGMPILDAQRHDCFVGYYELCNFHIKLNDIPTWSIMMMTTALVVRNIWSWKIPQKWRCAPFTPAWPKPKQPMLVNCTLWEVTLCCWTLYIVPRLDWSWNDQNLPIPSIYVIPSTVFQRHVDLGKSTIVKHTVNTLPAS